MVVAGPGPTEPWAGKSWFRPAFACLERLLKRTHPTNHGSVSSTGALNIQGLPAAMRETPQVNEVIFRTLLRSPVGRLPQIPLARLRMPGLVLSNIGLL